MNDLEIVMNSNEKEEDNNFLYKENSLKKYIDNSVLIKYDELFHIRMSNELLVKYNEGVFDKCLSSMFEGIKLLNSFNIKYPGKAKPVFYLYIVPFESYGGLLDYPATFDDGTGGGKPVPCYDLDGFSSALGYSENILEKSFIPFSSFVNDIHELAHLVEDMFYCKNRFIHEGFADALPFYGLDMEDEFSEYFDMICNLKDDDIYTASELLEIENSDKYDIDYLKPGINCSFLKGYVSSYLFTRLCLDRIVLKYNVSKKDSLSIYLNLIKCSSYVSKWLVYDIALELDLDKDKLYNTKEYQLEMIEQIKNYRR